MTLVVPFDGSDLSEAALVRATEFGNVLEEEVLAVSVIPEDNKLYAREKGWIGPEEEFDMERVVSTLHEQVTDLSPSAAFRYKAVDPYAPPGTISKALRTVAREEDAGLVVIGSENAGRFVRSVSSVGDSVAAADAYDVVIVRHRHESKIGALKHGSPHQGLKADE